MTTMKLEPGPLPGGCGKGAPGLRAGIEDGPEALGEDGPGLLVLVLEVAEDVPLLLQRWADAPGPGFDFILRVLLLPQPEIDERSRRELLVGERLLLRVGSAPRRPALGQQVASAGPRRMPELEGVPEAGWQAGEERAPRRT